MRLDLYLKENKNIQSRSRAKLLIEDGRVLLNNTVAINPSQNIKEGDVVEVSDFSYVSRAGYKLEYAYKKISHYPDLKVKNIEENFIKTLSELYSEFNFKNKTCLDIGSSTGGFTDFLLQNGASKVVSVDVGSDQFDKNLILKYRDKIELFENTDIRKCGELKIFKEINSDGGFDIIVCDVSFISLTHIIESIYKNLKKEGVGIILFKPQFEVGRENIKKGIVQDQDLAKKFLLERVKDFEKNNLKVLNTFESGIKGTDGNTEYIILLEKE